MDLQIRSAPPVAVIDIEGRIDHQTLPRLSREVDHCLGAGCTTLVLALGECRILMSSAIRFFIDVQDMAREAGGRLLLANVNPELRTIIERALLTDHFEAMRPLAATLADLQVAEEALADGLPEGDRRPTGLLNAVLEPEEEDDEDPPPAAAEE
jgi:anti-anti-sigma factor